MGDVLLFVSAGDHKVAGYAAPARSAPASVMAQEQADIATGVLPDWLVDRLGDLVALLLVGGLAVWLIPRLLERCVAALGARPLSAAGLGALALIIFFNGLIIALVLAGVTVASACSIDQRQLALVFWGVLSPPWFWPSLYSPWRSFTEAR
jgi:hypothetical protein